jgi:hypothetical protein
LRRDRALPETKKATSAKLAGNPPNPNVAAPTAVAAAAPLVLSAPR